MRHLCLGGSFNPVHLGHTGCAGQVAKKAGFDRVVLIPAAASPHKSGGIGLVGGEDRLAMCRLAADEANPGLFEVNDLELRRPPPSYTVDTVRQLKAMGWDQVSWLIGADQLAAFPRWRDSERLIEEAHIVVMARPGFRLDFDALPPAFRKLRANVVEVEPLDVSSTEIRRRVRASEPIAGLVSPAVERYILAHGLYR